MRYISLQKMGCQLFLHLDGLCRDGVRVVHFQRLLLRVAAARVGLGVGTTWTVATASKICKMILGVLNVRRD